MLFGAIGIEVGAAKTKVKPDGGTKLLDALLTADRDEREKVPDKGDYFRASSIGYLCPRELYLAKRDSVALKKTVSAQLAFTFAIGTAYHSALQSEIMPMMKDGVMQGYWRCTTCNRLHTGAAAEHDNSIDGGLMWTPRPQKCSDPDCKSHDSGSCEFAYVELSMKNEEFRITGHSDGILAWADGTEVADIKTANEYMFDSKFDASNGGSPSEDHVKQLMVYGWLLDHNGGLIKGHRLVYVKKGEESLKKALSEFSMARDETVLAGVRKLLLDCISVVDGDGSYVPNRLPECKVKTDKRAKGCQMCKACFK